jgi:urease accessory protein
VRPLDLTFARAPDGRTYLARQHVAWPFHVTRTFAYEGDPDGMATLVLQSVGAGLVEGDRIAVAARCGTGARAHVTTQGATIGHVMTGRDARLDQALILEPGAWLEWLPDPLILFAGATVAVTTVVTLAPDATLLLADGFLGHDPAAESRPFGRLTSLLELRDPDGRLIAFDRFAVEGAAFAAGLPGANGAFGAMATLVVAAGGQPAADLCDPLADALDGVTGAYAGVSVLPGDAGVVARVLASDGATMRAASARAWSAARRHLVGHDPAPRRK